MQFTDIPVVNITVSKATGWIEIPYHITKSSIGQVYVCSAKSASNQAFIFNIIAYGKWK